MPDYCKTGGSKKVKKKQLNDQVPKRRKLNQSQNNLPLDSNSSKIIRVVRLVNLSESSDISVSHF